MSGHLLIGATMPESIVIRDATEADIATITHHRVAMFEAMGSTTPAVIALLASETANFLEEAIPRGEYRGWLAGLADEPSRVVAGAGVQVRRVLPFPRGRADGRVEVALGCQAIVLNVYTEIQFRRRGLARRLMQEVFTWARANDLESLVLHAAPDGRALYEELGFTTTNEMRFMGDL